MNESQIEARRAQARRAFSQYVGMFSFKISIRNEQACSADHDALHILEVERPAFPQQQARFDAFLAAMGWVAEARNSRVSIFVPSSKEA